MSTRVFRRQLLLSTALVASALTGYGRRAYGACTIVGAGPQYSCSGANAVPLAINFNNADVSTVAGFSVTTAAGTALTITGDGALSYTDTNASPLTGTPAALFIQSNGDDGLTPGSVTVNTNGTLIGTDSGIDARNYGSGAMDVTANGNVTGTNAWGIYALNSSNGTDLNVTTAAGTTVTGGNFGIYARNFGSGTLDITANGDVTGTNSGGIFARNYGTDFYVSTGTGTTVTGGANGITARNYGSGALDIEANGNVTGTVLYGILARNSAAGTDLSVTTGTGTTVSGGVFGIVSRNYGGGALDITANGDVTGTSNAGIYVRNFGTDLTVTTATGTIVTGANNGIMARNFGSGALEITANGSVTGTNFYGVFARNSGAGTDLSVTTGGAVLGGFTGIAARNYGSGALDITAIGNVTGTNQYGIYARNSTNGTDLSVTTGAGTTATGGKRGIDARNSGSGALDITANGNVTGTSQYGIYSRNNAAGTDLSVTTGVGTTVTGGYSGIGAFNFGTKSLDIIANGNVTGTIGIGIIAHNHGTDLTVTTAAGTTVGGGRFGIVSRNYGGALDITANGNVTGTSNLGIYAFNGFSATDLSVTTAAGTTVTGGLTGIFARNFGTGALDIEANGNVTGTNTHGIFAYNWTTGTDLSVTTGAGTTVTGGQRGIDARNSGTGALDITANGNVTGTMQFGVYARNFGTDLSVTTGAGTTVTGKYFGIRALNYGTGAVDVTANGNVTGTNQAGIFVQNQGTSTTITTAAGTTVSGAYGIVAGTIGSGPLTITANGNVTGTAGDGIYAKSFGGAPINITVAATSAVAGTGFGIRTGGAAADVTVAGTINGGAGGAISFNCGCTDDRLELHPTAVINGLVLAGGGTDTFVLGGTGTASFDVGLIGTQYLDFETFEKEEASHWTLTGTQNAGISSWDVNGGLLSVNATMQNTTFFVNAGTLGGTGTIGGLFASAGAKVAPGNSIGTLTVNGNAGLAAGSIFEVEVNAAGQSDLLVVNGTVSLTGAILSVLADPGSYAAATSYLIIDNDGVDPVTGTFGSVTTSLAFLTPSVSYTANTGNDVVLTLTRNNTTFTTVAQTPNQKAVAGALGTLPMSDPLVQAIIGQTTTGALQAFDALSGELHASVSGVLVQDSRYVRDAIFARLLQAFYGGGGNAQVALAAGGPTVAQSNDPLPGMMALGATGKARAAAPPPASGIAFWAQGYGAWGDIDSNGNAGSVDRTLGGFVSGMDVGLGGGWRGGVATGYAQSNISVDARLSSADVESYHLAGYLGGRLGGLALRGGGAWTWNEIDTTRAIVFPGFFQRAEASYDGDTGQVFAEAALPFADASLAWEPFARLAYVHVDTGGFTESGGIAALNSAGGDESVGYSSLGVRVAGTMFFAGTRITPHASLAWQHAFGDVEPDQSLAFAANGAGFTVFGAPLARNSALLDAGVQAAVAPDASIGLSYSGQLAEDVADHAVTGRFDWRF